MKRFYFYLLASLLIAPTYIFAQGVGNPGGQGVGNPGGVGIPNPLGNQTIVGLFTTLLQILLVFAVPIVVFFIIYAGFLYVTARGNVEQITQAHRALLYALIGGVLILGGTVLIQVVQNTVNAVRSGS